MPRRDGSEKGDEFIHYACGLPFIDHDDTIKNGKLALLCPDEKPNAFNQQARPTGQPFTEDPEDMRYG